MSIRCTKCGAEFGGRDELKRDRQFLDVISRDPFYGIYEPILVCPRCGWDEFEETEVKEND